MPYGGKLVSFLDREHHRNANWFCAGQNSADATSEFQTSDAILEVTGDAAKAFALVVAAKAFATGPCRVVRNHQSYVYTAMPNECKI